jgi:hypothetical protein
MDLNSKLYVYACMSEDLLTVMSRNEDFLNKLKQLEDMPLYWKMRCEFILGAKGSTDSVDVSDWRDIYKILSVGDIHKGWGLNSVIENAVKHNNRTAVLLCIAAKIATEDVEVAIKDAINNGYIDIVEIIYNARPFPYLLNNISLVNVARKGHWEIIDFLLKHSEYSIEEREDALKDAVILGTDKHILVINKLLETNIDPSYDNNYLFREALIYGNMNVAKILLNDGVNFNQLDIDYVLRNVKVNNYENVSNFIKHELYGNAIGGMIVGYKIEGRGEMPNIYASLPIVWNDEEQFFYNFIRHIVETKKSLLDYIYWLSDNVITADFKIKKQVNLAAENTLILTTNNRRSEYGDLYFAIRGFLLLCWEPIYKIYEILIMITNEGASDKALEMAGSLMGAYIGLKELQEKHDIIVPYSSTKSINNYIDNISLVR